LSEVNMIESSFQP